MGIYKYIREAWRNPSEDVSKLMKERLMKWRREPITVRIESPTRLDRARSLGYKAKQGFILARQKVNRGGHKRAMDFGGRRPKRTSSRKNLNVNYQTIAEQRAASKFPNCEVLNSYYVAEDGKHFWYEVILVDKAHPAILADPSISWIADKQHKGRVYRGLTASARASRGLLNKGKGAEKLRPSKTATYRRKVRSWHLSAENKRL